MLSSVLNSDRAVQMNIALCAFLQLRAMLATHEIERIRLEGAMTRISAISPLW